MLIRKPAESSATWSRAQRIIHWTIAALVALGGAAAPDFGAEYVRGLSDNMLMHRITVAKKRLAAREREHHLATTGRDRDTTHTL